MSLMVGVDAFQLLTCLYASVQWRSMSVRVNVRLPDGLWEQVGSRAGELGQTRTVFVVRALEQALDGFAVARPVSREVRSAEVGPEKAPRSPEEVPAPARAHDEYRRVFEQAKADTFAGKPQRHEFGSGAEWQAAMRVWKAGQ